MCGRVSRILAIPPVRPKRQTPHSQAVGQDSERSLPTGTPPLPTSSPHSFLRDRQSLHFPLPVLSSLPPLARSLPLLSSSYPHLSNLRFHPPPLASPPRSRLPHPWEAPPVGQSSLYKRVPCPGAAAAGRRQLCWCGGGEPRIKRPRPERAGHHPHRPSARPPDGRSPAGLRSRSTPAPPRAPLPPLPETQLAERLPLPPPPPSPRQIPAAATLCRPGPFRPGPGTPAPRQPRPRHHVGEERGGSGRVERQGTGGGGGGPHPALPQSTARLCAPGRPRQPHAALVPGPGGPSPPSPRSPTWRCLPGSARRPPAPSSFPSCAPGSARAPLRSPPLFGPGPHSWPRPISRRNSPAGFSLAGLSPRAVSPSPLPV